MSDRIAVFNDGRIEQVGTPAEVYERPATPFVAGFVGTSNLLDATVEGAAVHGGTLGSDGVALLGPGTRPARGSRSRCGRRRSACRTVGRGRRGDLPCARDDHEVVYLGTVTRYLVAIAGAGNVVVLEQNLDTTSMEALGAQGRAVAADVAAAAHIRHRLMAREQRRRTEAQ